MGNGAGNISIQRQFKFRLVLIVFDGRLDDPDIGKGGVQGGGRDPGRERFLSQPGHILRKVGSGLQRRA
ncbi:hypothetical protein D3C78_1315860 [compost metagenome]